MDQNNGTTMGRRDFDSDMDEYLASRNGSFLRRMFSSSKPAEAHAPPKQDLHPAMEPYDDGASAAAAQHETPRKPGFFSRLFGGSADETVTVDVSAPSSDALADLKEVARITLKVIKMLPPEQLDGFKRNADFDRFKEILKKHHLVK